MENPKLERERERERTVGDGAIPTCLTRLASLALLVAVILYVVKFCAAGFCAVCVRWLLFFFLGFRKSHLCLHMYGACVEWHRGCA